MCILVSLPAKMADMMLVPNVKRVEELLPKLAEVIGKMRYVAEGQYVYSEDPNTIRQFIKEVKLEDGQVVVRGAIEAVRRAYEEYRFVRDRDPFIEELIDMAEENYRQSRAVFFGTTVEARDHNTLLNALKALEVAIRRMEEGLQA